ncbi:MAG: crossover junction endodeoxyribonuclease RuvC [Pseudomonadota bacterium]
MTDRVCILGVDPGSRVTGYGVICQDGRRWLHVDSGVIRTSGKDFHARLRTIHAAAADLFIKHEPDELAIESVFVSANASSALKLGAARSAVLCASFAFGTEIHEYAPRAIKQAIAGNGAADKAAVQHMVRLQLTGAPKGLPHDASDALAIALCHAHSRRVRQVASEVGA